MLSKVWLEGAGLNYDICRATWLSIPKNACSPLPQSLWHLGWWGRHSLVPRRCTPLHARAPAAQPCTLWKPLPTHALFGHWSNWQSMCRPGWVAPSGPTPYDQWRFLRSSWSTEKCYNKLLHRCCRVSRLKICFKGRSIPSCHLPHFYGFIPWSRNDVISVGHDGYRRNIVVMS